MSSLKKSRSAASTRPPMPLDCRFRRAIRVTAGKSNMGQLRFATFVRVSTEGQFDKGATDAQLKAVNAAVKKLGGKVVHAFEGHEHATEGYEKRDFQKLLKPAERKKIDAVMFYDSSRFPRSQSEGAEAVGVFRANGTQRAALGRWRSPRTLIRQGLGNVEHGSSRAADGR
jgi:hypothetical protein